MFKKYALIAAFLGLTGLVAYNVDAKQGSGDMTLTSGGRNATREFVYNGDAHQTREVGDVVVWVDGTYDGVEIGTSVTRNDGLVAGVVVQADIAPGTWGWIQTSGYVATINVTGGVVAGEGIITSTTAESGSPYAIVYATGTYTNEGNTFGVLGVALSAQGAGSTVSGFLFR